MKKCKINVKLKRKDVSSINVEGNNGGDILEIVDNKDGTIYLRSGHCCVISVDKIVPVEFLTAIISEVMLNHNNNVNEVIDSFGWSQEFKDSLKLKVESDY